MIQTNFDLDNWIEWTDNVVEHFTNDFYNKYQSFVYNNNLCDHWMNKLYNKSPYDAAKIIERAHRIYCKNLK